MTCISLSKRLLTALSVLACGVAAAFLMGRSSDTPAKTEYSESAEMVSSGRLSVQKLDYDPNELIRLNQMGMGGNYLVASQIPPGTVDQTIVYRAFRPIMPEDYAALKNMKNQSADASIANNDFSATPVDSRYPNMPTRPCLRYRTIQGDSLKSLAYKFLKTEKRCLEIYELNKDQLSAQGKVPEGIILFIPAE